MTTERLREAAARLRDAAVHDANNDVGLGDGDLSVYLDANVALTLADWLDDHAGHVQHMEDTGCVPSDWLGIFPHEFAVADAILGEG